MLFRWKCLQQLNSDGVHSHRRAFLKNILTFARVLKQQPSPTFQRRPPCLLDCSECFFCCPKAVSGIGYVSVRGCHRSVQTTESAQDARTFLSPRKRARSGSVQFERVIKKSVGCRKGEGLQIDLLSQDQKKRMLSVEVKKENKRLFHRDSRL